MEYMETKEYISDSVIPRFWGRYDPLKSYSRNDVVLSSGSSYRSKIHNNTNLPTDDSPYWDLMAKGGFITDVKILSSSGNVIMNFSEEIVLTAYVFYNGEDISDEIDSQYYSWVRKSPDETSDVIWNKKHEGVGRSITITKGDFYNKAIIECNVLLT